MQSLALVNRIVRAAKLDVNLYEEVEADTAANGQAFLVVILASLATGIGIGIAGLFKIAGVWSIWGLLIGLTGSIIVWLAWSFLAYLIGTKIFKGSDTSATMGELLRAIGFSISPGILGIFVFMPVVGGIVWFGASIWVLIAGVVAVRQALDFPIGRAIVTCLVSWFACILIVSLAVTPLSARLFSGSCASGNSFDNNLNSIVEPYRFNIVTWEVVAISHELSQWMRSRDEDIDNTIAIVIEYFSATEERRKSLENILERILESQIEEILIEEDILGFPPVNLKLGTLPRLHVISPRGKIESMREIMLDPGLSLQEIEDIEARTDELDVSSLVVKLGGFGGLYPSFVTNSADLRFTIDTAVEEWIHQYLAFKPLGFRYVLDLLGIARSYEIATINETAVSMVSKEISTIVCDRYYPRQKEFEEDMSGFDREMRDIRLAVDDYLARGEIETAEEFMEQKRQYLASKGHYIRKLNQAYFAWYGTYADKPSSVSPIGVELRQLRSECGSVKEFLDTVAEMTRRQDLKDSIELLQ
ncbi:Yip1 family protein [Chloroflexota bacterium]